MAKRRPTGPVLPDEADTLLKPLLAYCGVLLAVSGGSDSSALMHLVAAWRTRVGPSAPDVAVATVDHNIRTGSAAEAAGVGVVAKSLALPHRVLTITEPAPVGFKQAWGRYVRYVSLTAHVRKLWPSGRVAIVMAHTEDDQAETLLMRLMRGSGVDGLASMAPRRPTEEPDVDIVRPLLSVPKERLIETLKGIDATWAEDPSNANPQFERVRQRAMSADLAKIGLNTYAMGLSARRLGRARQALEAMTDAAFGTADIITISPLGYASVDWPSLCLWPEEIRLRALTRLLIAVGGASEPVSLEALEAMTEGQGWAEPHGLTLAGAALRAGRHGRLDIVREPQRIGDQAVPLEPGQTIRWDNRFDVVFRASPKKSAPRAPIVVGPLGVDGVRTLEAQGVPRPPVPAFALRALPAVRGGETLIAVPTLSFETEAVPITAIFRGLALVRRHPPASPA